jgi:hypothetical protein
VSVSVSMMLMSCSTWTIDRIFSSGRSMRMPSGKIVLSFWQASVNKTWIRFATAVAVSPLPIWNRRGLPLGVVRSSCTFANSSLLHSSKDVSGSLRPPDQMIECVRRTLFSS